MVLCRISSFIRPFRSSAVALNGGGTDKNNTNKDESSKNALRFVPEDFTKFKDQNLTWVDKRAPKKLAPYLKLMRVDRPIGTLKSEWLCLLFRV
jgi:hypothetical protein